VRSAGQPATRDYGWDVKSFSYIKQSTQEVKFLQFFFMNETRLILK
jgi:hypothetical protein